MEDHAFVALRWQTRISVDCGEHFRGGLSAGGQSFNATERPDQFCGADHAERAGPSEGQLPEGQQ
jgi:hypothetical protein